MTEPSGQGPGDTRRPFEHEIREELTRKIAALEAAHDALRGRVGTEPLPVAELFRALELAAATVRDCAVCQEDHFGGLIRLQPETLGDTIVALRAAEALTRDVAAILLPFAAA